MKRMLLKRVLLGSLVAGMWLPAITCDMSGLDRWWDGYYYYPTTYYYEETHYYYDDYYWGDPYGYSGSGWGLDFWLGGWW